MGKWMTRNGITHLFNGTHHGLSVCQTSKTKMSVCTDLSTAKLCPGCVCPKEERDAGYERRCVEIRRIALMDERRRNEVNDA